MPRDPRGRGGSRYRTVTGDWVTKGAERIHSLAGAFRYIRERRELSARGLSIRAGLSPSYVGKLEAGEIEPSVKAFTAICRALDLSQREILFCILCAFKEHT